MSLAGYKNKKLIVPDMRILILIKKSPISCRRILAKNKKSHYYWGIRILAYASP